MALKTHYAEPASVTYSNDGDNHVTQNYTKPLCGQNETLPKSDNVDEVTCKNCLRKLRERGQI